MKNNIQLLKQNKTIQKLNKKYGDKNSCSIYGAGCVKSPQFVFVFMNPTARNISTQKDWKGPKVPWVGLKQTWKLFYEIGVIDKEFFEITQKLKPKEWTGEFAEKLFENLAEHKVFTTMLAKCVQADARQLPDAVFGEYREEFLKELNDLSAENIITFGNQVSSILLGKKIGVSSYNGNKHEILSDGKKKYKVYPCFYPIGRGWMNVGKVIKRVKTIKKSLNK